MRARYSNYPIGKLLLNVIDQSGLDPKAFFAELGFTNFSKAIERLDCWLERGEGNILLLERLQSSRFAVQGNLLKQVMAETDALLQREREAVTKRQEDEARKTFQPCLEVIPELSRPTQITMFCLTGGNRRFGARLPDNISAWPWKDQLAYLKRLVSENFAKHQGRTYFTGKIIGYLYRPTFDSEPIQLGTSTVFERVHVDAVQIVGIQIESRGISRGGALRGLASNLTSGLSSAFVS